MPHPPLRPSAQEARDETTDWPADSAVESDGSRIALGRPAAVGTTEAARRELHPLLRRRLGMVAMLATWGFLLLCVADGGRYGGIGPLWNNAQGRTLLVLHAGGVVLYLAAVFLLARLDWLPVRWMRAVELVGFAYAALTFAIEGLTAHPAALAEAMELPGTSHIQAYASVLPWFMLITMYGVLVPNTGRRAAVVVFAFVLAALSVLAATWLRDGASAARVASTLPLALGWLGIGAGLVVFNSARMDAYRRAVASAREVGRYRLLRKLGHGGMGEVYLAEHRLLKRPCAVKLIRPERAMDTTFIARFEREVSATTQLTHPAAIQVYDYGQAHDGTLYYVMEYLPGLTLDELVARTGALPIGRAVSILRQICGALGEAHGLGLIHRDVKPSNVMLCQLGGRADVVKLLDFGLVRAAAMEPDARLTQDGSLLGTPAFMSPEQARGADNLGPASDLYSLGALAYFLLVGHPPFAGKNALEILHAHLSQPVTPPHALRSEIPRELEAIVLQLLEKTPEARPPGADAIDALLARSEPGSDWSAEDAERWWREFEQMEERVDGRLSGESEAPRRDLPTSSWDSLRGATDEGRYAPNDAGRR